MMNHKIFLFLILLLAPIANCLGQNEADLIVNRHRQYLLQADTTSELNAETLMNLFDPHSRRWKNIDYTNNTPADWQIKNHLSNVKILANYWAHHANKKNNPAVFKNIIAALDEWHEQRFKNPNWWHNEIGVPLLMRDILVLMRPALTQKQLDDYLEIVNQFKMKGTGANLIWSSDIGLFYGLLSGKVDIANKAATFIQNEIKISDHEGLKPDYSFHQHNARLQMYQYGRTFLIDNIRLAWELRNTKWAYPSEKIKLLGSMLLQGWQWMARGINTVPETMDRSSTREGALREADVRDYIKYFIELHPANQSLYQQVKDNQEGKPYSLKGFKYFPYSDFTTYHNSEYSFFLKTISSRTLSTESINYENLKGKLLNSGETYFIKTGNEYFNLMPVWKWNRLPGITAFDGADKISRKNFSGSVTDGNAGVTSMEYKMMAKDTNTFLSCKKTWFVVKDVMICLLSDIKFSGIDEAYTGLNQSRLTGNVYTDKKVLQPGVQQVLKTKWLYHDGFAYMPLYNTEMSLYADTASGSWYDINQSYSNNIIVEKIFMPSIKHVAANGKAGYWVSYTKSKNEIKKIAQNPSFKILTNDKNSQSIIFKNDFFMAAFHEKTKITAGKNTIEVDRPSLLLYSKNYFYLSDPTHNGGMLNFIFNKKKYSTTLPADGSTIKIMQ